jgi:hypothetical protein
MAFSQVKPFLDNAYISQQNCLPFCLLIKQGHVIVKHNLLFFSASGGIGDGHPLGFDVTLLIKWHRLIILILAIIIYCDLG